MISAAPDGLHEAYHDKRLLITGATGFVGTHLLRALAASGAAIAAISRSDSPMPGVARVFAGDLADSAFVGSSIAEWQPEVIWHLAGARERSLSRDAFDRNIAANLIGTLNLLQAALGHSQLQRIVVLGTGEEYGRNAAPFRETMREAPVSAYSFSKQCATHLSQLMHASFGLPVVVVRPSLAYGPGQHSDMFLPALIHSLLRGEPFAMTRGEQTRDYVYVGDLVEALLRAGVGTGIDGEIINIGSGQATRIADLVRRVEALLDAPGLVRLGALEYRTGEAMEYSFDVDKARTALGWLPQTSIDAGLRSTIAWFREQHDAR